MFLISLAFSLLPDASIGKDEPDQLAAAFRVEVGQLDLRHIDLYLYLGEVFYKTSGYSKDVKLWKCFLCSS